MSVKVRAWAGDGMVYPDHKMFLGISAGKIIDEFSEENIMWGTGFEDKNGKQIYDKDIAKVLGQYIEYEFFEVTKYANGGWGLKGGEMYLSEIEEQHIEIVGNCYENPELLENNKP